MTWRWFLLVTAGFCTGLSEIEAARRSTCKRRSERSVVDRAEIEGIEYPGRSLMPDGLLDVLTGADVRDLIAYLMSPGQVPLPKGNPSGNAAVSK